MKFLVALVIAISSLELVVGNTRAMNEYINKKTWLKLNYGCGNDIVLFTDYTGKHSTTVTGKTCLHWKDATKKKYRPSSYPMLQENYCRNPSNSLEGPWCYVKNTKKAGQFEWCDIPKCPKYKNLIGKEGCPKGVDGKYDPSQLYNYNGTMDMTNDGRKCINWNQIVYKTPGSDLRFNPKNYARAVGGRSTPYCYTINASNKRVWKPFLNPCV